MTIIDHEVRKGGKDYSILIEWEHPVSDALNDQAVFKITGRAREVGTGKEERLTLSAELRIDERVIVVSEDETGVEIAKIPLDIDLPGDDIEGLDVDPDVETTLIFSEAVLVDGAERALSERAKEQLEETTVELLIQAIPTDPFLGCIVKGAVSTLVGQVVRCARAVEGSAVDERGAWQKARDIGSCVAEYGWRMGYTFMWRAGRCAVLLGAG